jgi:hypothetical protein
VSVSHEKVEYHGWKNNLKLRNDHVELLITLDVGPRILGYRLAGGSNVLKEYADQLGKSGEKDWQIRGGHRLWTSPEDLKRTYAPDNSPVAHQELPGGIIRLMPPPDHDNGIQKEIDVALAAEGSQVLLVHRITNVGDKPSTLAPWALTVLAPGGVEIIPLPAKKPHPGPPSQARSPLDYAPNQRVVLWPFFDFTDPRWRLGSRWIFLRHDAARGPTKIGLAHRLGWVGHLNAGTLFVKRFDFQHGKQYPDGGCNFETFTNEDMIEMESLGPTAEVKPGDRVELVERWELHRLPAEVRDEDDANRHVLPLLGTGDHQG